MACLWLLALGTLGALAGLAFEVATAPPPVPPMPLAQFVLGTWEATDGSRQRVTFTEAGEVSMLGDKKVVVRGKWFLVLDEVELRDAHDGGGVPFHSRVGFFLGRNGEELSIGRPRNESDRDERGLRIFCPFHMGDRLSLTRIQD